MSLDETSIAKDPFYQFRNWFEDAKATGMTDPNAMILATVSSKGQPSSRVVLMKEMVTEGFTFYTNYNSRKAKEIEENPSVALLFFWNELFRQVRIEGKLEKVDPQMSDDYFMSRPRGSRIGAWASPQSEKIKSRMELMTFLEKVEKHFDGKDVTRPSWWGGYLLIPRRFEFWEGQEDRLHNRICFERNENGNWEVFRLSP